MLEFMYRMRYRDGDIFGKELNDTYSCLPLKNQQLLFGLDLT